MVNRLILVSTCIALLSACGGKKQTQQSPVHTVKESYQPTIEETDKEISKEVDMIDLDDDTEDVIIEQPKVVKVRKKQSQKSSHHQVSQPHVVYQEITVMTDGDISNLDPVYTIFDNE